MPHAAPQGHRRTQSSNWGLATELEPQQFKWSERASLPQIVGGMGQADLLLTHEPSGYWFLFEEESPWRYEYSPGLERTSESGAAHQWESMLMHVKIWPVAVRENFLSRICGPNYRQGASSQGVGESVGEMTRLHRKRARAVHPNCAKHAST